MPKAVPSKQEAMRFLDRLYAVAEQDGQAQSARLWIDPNTSSAEWRAVRRGLCLKVIHEVNDHTVGPDIFATYPGTKEVSTEDLYHAACLDVFKGLIQLRSQAATVRMLNSQELVIGKPQLQLAQDAIARRISESARKVLEVGRLLDAPVSDKRAIPELDYAEWKAVVNTHGNRDTTVVRLRRIVYMREVNRGGDDLLKLLMKLPNGVDIVDQFGRGAAEGKQVALQSLASCAQAIVELRAKITADATETWKYPPALAHGATAVAKEAGQAQMTGNLTHLALAWAPHELSVAESVVGALNNAILALVLLGPVGAIAADILSIALAVMETAINVLKELEQDQAAQASTFADDGDKLSSGGKVGQAALKGVLSIAAAVTPVGLARVLGRSARVGEEVGSAVVSDTRAIKQGEQEINDARRGLTRESGDAARGKYQDLDREWPSSPQRDPKSFSEAEIAQAKTDVVDDFKRNISRKAVREPATKALDYVNMAGTPAQKETFGRLTGRTLGEQPVRGVPAGLKAERADLLRQAETQAEDLRRRLKAHWDDALPSRGNQTAEDAAREIFATVSKMGLKPSEAGEIIRARLFGNWRSRFLTSVGNDTKLVEDLRTQACVTFNPEPGAYGNAFGVPFRDARGNYSLVGLDIDHAAIGHKDAVIQAFRTGDSRKLLSTINSDGLQLLTERENRNFIETVRKLVPPPAAPRALPQSTAINPLQRAVSAVGDVANEQQRRSDDSRRQ